MTTTLRVGVDIDDVLYPWSAVAHELSLRAGLTDREQLPATWAPFEEYGCTADEWYAVLADGARTGELYFARPMPGAREALERIAAAGHTLHLVTARGFLHNGHLIRRHTCQWLDAHRIPHHTLTFSKRKAVVATDVFVDDSEKNAHELTQAGVRFYLHDAAHNRHVDGFDRVANIAEFAERILHA